LPVVLGMYAGQRMRDKIAPETLKKLVLIAVIAADSRVAAAWCLQLRSLAGGGGSGCRRSVGKLRRRQ
jgi:hypothetical protein